MASIRHRPLKADAKLGAFIAPSPWLSQQFRRPHQIVGDRGEGEAPIDLRLAAQFGPAQAGDGLDPAERLLDPLADALALGVARMARGAPVDRRASAAGVAGDVLRVFNVPMKAPLSCLVKVPRVIAMTCLLA
jgi:hypothetical protein